MEWGGGTELLISVSGVGRRNITVKSVYLEWGGGTELLNQRIWSGAEEPNF